MAFLRVLERTLKHIAICGGRNSHHLSSALLSQNRSQRQSSVLAQQNIPLPSHTFWQQRWTGEAPGTMEDASVIPKMAKIAEIPRLDNAGVLAEMPTNP